MIYEPSEKDKKNIENNFTYHAPKDGQSERYEEIRAQAKAFAEKLVRLCPPSRELSVALTEESCEHDDTKYRIEKVIGYLSDMLHGFDTDE